jgi:putative aldouronate transport system substrate-binding protein
MKLIVLAMTLILTVMSFAACGKKDEATNTEGVTQTETAKPTESTTKDSSKDTATEPEATEAPLPPLQLSVMLPYGTNEHDEEDLTKRFYGAIEEYTNTDVEWVFYSSDMYYEKLALVFASGDIPSVLVSGKSPEFLNAVENDAFWDISEYIYDYPNLAQLPEAVFQNASINGKLYGVPRSRDLGRNGFGYRLDWLNNLGLKEPETIDELYDMLNGFTYDDPDGNGKDDTYGLGVTSYAGTWDIMQVWFGVPNGWGIDANEDLIPAHMTEEYNNALKWFRKVYSEGLVNPDFDTVAGGDWDTVLLRSGVAGASADVVDRFRRNQEYFENEGIPAETMIIGAVDAGHGLRTYPTSGYADMIAISKQKVKTEEELRRVLQFLNDMNDAEMLKLVEFGFEDVSYKLDENGYGVYLTEEEKTELGVPIYNFRDGMNQLLAYYISPEENAKRLTTEPPTSEIRLMETAVKIENAKYAVVNHGASYTSPSYVELGSVLDPIMADARIAYIKGEIDDVGLQEAKDQWLRSGGETVIKEINDLYDANK